MTSSDDDYFLSYGDYEAHEKMLRDRPRNCAYDAALRCSIERFVAAGIAPIVLDVGCGTGFLSILAARHGARHVYAVEASPLAAPGGITETLIAANSVTDRITVLRGRLEDSIQSIRTLVKATMKDSIGSGGTTAERPVHIVVSEWMGFYLLHEGMLPSVLTARDKLLAPSPSGVLLPSSAVLRIAAAAHPCWSRVSQWVNEADDTYCGVQLAPLAPIAAAALASAPILAVVPAEVIASIPVDVLRLDLTTVKASELDSISAQCPLHFEQAAPAVNAVVMWFDVAFAGPAGGGDSSCITLSTAPSAPPTHWMQTGVCFGQLLAADAGDTIPLVVSMQREDRRYEVSISIE